MAKGYYQTFLRGMEGVCNWLSFKAFKTQKEKKTKEQFLFSSVDKITIKLGLFHLKRRMLE